jgi:chitinase
MLEATDMNLRTTAFSLALLVAAGCEDGRIVPSSVRRTRPAAGGSTTAAPGSGKPTPPAAPVTAPPSSTPGGYTDPPAGSPPPEPTPPPATDPGARPPPDKVPPPPPASRDAGAVVDAPAPPVDLGPAPLPPHPLDGLAKGSLVVYWGQNGAGGRTTDKTQWEKSLGDTCRANPQYDALVLAFIISFGDPGNASGGPRMNYAFHCEDRYDDQNPLLLRCPDIGEDIIACQQMGKKVLLSLGGASGSYTFAGDAAAEKFAQLTWDMFLNGKSDVRPFGRAVPDGVDLDIEGGQFTGYTAFVRKIRALMKTDPARRYLITGAPQCPFPDAYMGPGPGKVLGEAASEFDYLFVQFYNNFCFASSGAPFRDALTQWTRLAGPKILIGMPADPAAGGGFVGPGDLGGILDLVKNGNGNPLGVMLWDASYDQLNSTGGKPYSASIRAGMR